ncbi:hypothetical protein Tco_1087245 [Tanacetum coccineum]
MNAIVLESGFLNCCGLCVSVNAWSIMWTDMLFCATCEVMCIDVWTKSGGLLAGFPMACFWKLRDRNWKLHFEHSGGLLAGIHGLFSGRYCGLDRRVTCGYPWPGLEGNHRDFGMIQERFRSSAWCLRDRMSTPTQCWHSMGLSEGVHLRHSRDAPGRGLVRPAPPQPSRTSSSLTHDSPILIPLIKPGRPRERNIDEYWWRIYKSGDLEVLES